MDVRIYQVDAFADKAFVGNPAAVCILSGPRDEGWMQAVAKEMNLSETAFLYGEAEGFRLRWFTPAVEVDLCGHATLASAHILWETGLLGRDEKAHFDTRSGVLTAERRGNWIELDFPSELEAPTEAPRELIDALGIRPGYMGRNRFDYLMEVESEEIVKDVKPDFVQLAKIPARGIIVTSLATSEDYDFVSRFFAPAVGVNEDPVTGSAHCCLGPFWSSRLRKTDLIGYQASQRGGVVRVRVGRDRVYLGGQAVTVLCGALLG